MNSGECLDLPPGLFSKWPSKRWTYDFFFKFVYVNMSKHSAHIRLISTNFFLKFLIYLHLSTFIYIYLHLSTYQHCTFNMAAISNLTARTTFYYEISFRKQPVKEVALSTNVLKYWNWVSYKGNMTCKLLNWKVCFIYCSDVPSTNAVVQYW